MQIVIFITACAAMANAATITLASGAVVPHESGVSTQVFYSAAFEDNIVAGTPQTVAFAQARHYTFVDSSNGLFFTRNATGLLPLQTFYSSLLNDTLTTASPAGLAWASDPAHGYVFQRIEGFCNTGPPPVDSFSFVFVQYWDETRKDTFIVLVGSINEGNAVGAKYQRVWDECWTAPPVNWTVWPDSGAAVQIPFPKSQDILGFSYLPGANANYGGADTWFPSWAADGNLYSPWTDGTVNGVTSSSGARPPAFMSTTGMATILGDNPFNLTLEGVHLFACSSFPFRSRYPCGTLVHNGTWYYGTYYLDNPNATTAQGDPLGPNPGPNCGNWCVQGPVVDFRRSVDGGNTWEEPRMNASGPFDNLFGETCIRNQKVKFGAPHFVDFGRDMANSPDGMAYIVGHGASRPGAVQAWMLGDEVYMARAAPANINTRALWQFYAGGHGAGAVWVTGNVSAAVPLLTWNDHTGVVTMTYHPAVKKYIMAIGTASFYPSMVEQFDTYFLESDDITGPFSYITYLSQFGPEAYFVHFPSKFLATNISSGSATYSAFLSYSADFASGGSDPSPPGSGYHWSLQQSQLMLSADFVARLVA